MGMPTALAASTTNMQTGRNENQVEKHKVANLIDYEIKNLKQRKLDEDTCKK